MKSDDKKQQSKNPAERPLESLDDLLQILDADELRHAAGGRAVRHVTVRR